MAATPLTERLLAEIKRVEEVLAAKLESVIATTTGIKETMGAQYEHTCRELEDHSSRLGLLERIPGQRALKIIAVISTSLGVPALVGLLILLITHGLIKP